MITDVTAVLMRDFAANMQGRIERHDRGDSAEPAATAATPAKGFSLGMRAALIALSRVLLQVRSFSPAAQQDQAVRADAARAGHQQQAPPQPPFRVADHARILARRPRPHQLVWNHRRAQGGQATAAKPNVGGERRR
jgi:hypothetical protein